MEFYYHDVERDVLILAADGGIDAYNTEQFLGDLGKVVEAGVTKLVVDCRQVLSISSMGVAALVLVHKRLAERGGHVKLAAVQTRVFRILQITRLNTVFQIYPTVDEALQAFRDA